MDDFRDGRLTSRARRALGLIGAAALLVAAAALYWLHPPAAPTAPAAATPPLPVALTDWQFFDRDHGWVLLNSETDPISGLFATSDGGVHWRALGSGHGMVAFAFHFFDTRNGALEAFGGSSGWVLWTSDGGRSWRPTPMPAEYPDGLVLVDARNLLALASPSAPDLAASADGGLSWTHFTMTGLPPGTRTLVGFRDPDNGWLAVGDTVFRTRDGGRSWTPAPVPGGFGDGLRPRALAFVPGGVMLATTAIGAAPARAVVYPSRDGGETWEPPRPAEPDGAGPQPVPRTAFADHDHWLTPDRATIWSTADAGRTWRAAVAALPPGLELGKTRFTSPQDGWSLTQRATLGVGTPVLLRTTDAGRHWAEVRLPRLG